MADKYNADGTVSEQWFAEEIAKKEGKKKQVNIGQIKEVLDITLKILAGLTSEEANVLLQKHR